MNKNILLLLSVLSVLLFSCDTYKRTASSKHLAKACADKFPVVQTEIYVEGATKFDTLYTEKVVYDSFPCPPADVEIKYKTQVRVRDTCISRYRIDTFRITKRDSAAIRVLNDIITAKDNNLTEVLKRLEKQEKRGDKYQRLFIWPWMLILGLLIYIFRKPLFSLITKIPTR